MSYPLILYHNGLADGTLTATSTATGYHVNNILTATDPWLRWKAGGTGTINLTIDHGASGAQALDTIALTTHNLDACGGSVSASWSDDGAAWTGASVLSAGAQMTRTYGRTVILDTSGITGMDGAHRYHRLTFASTTSALYIGAACWGRKLALTEYMHGSFDPLSLDVRLKSPASLTGNPLRACVESIKQIVTLKGPKGGMASAFYHDATHSKMGVTSPNWQEFMSEVWSQGGRFWFAFDAGNQAYRQGWLAWCKANDDMSTQVVTPSGAGSRRAWKADVCVFAEGMAAA